MALVVITLQDEDETVDVKFLFEPMVKDSENTSAQVLAARMLGVVSDALGGEDPDE